MSFKCSNCWYNDFQSLHSEGDISSFHSRFVCHKFCIKIFALIETGLIQPSGSYNLAIVDKTERFVLGVWADNVTLNPNASSIGRHNIP